MLAGLCFSLTLLAYARYAERPDSKPRYALVLLALACGLLSKPTVVTLPFVLLLLDFWPLGRLRASPGASARRVWLEKLPHARAGAGRERGHASRCSARAAAWSSRSARCRWMSASGTRSTAYGVYLVQTVWPSDLSVFYPHPGEAISRGRAALAGVLLVAVSGAALALARRAPYLLVGWFWYLIMLVPVIGIVQVGMQAHADRYMYLPLQGLAIAAAWGAVDLVGSSQARRRALAAFAALLVLLLAVAAHRQTATWRDSLTLFGRAVALDPSSLVTQHRLAVALRKAGRLDEAQQRYQEIVKREPRWAAPWLELGAVLEERGDLARGAGALSGGPAARSAALRRSREPRARAAPDGTRRGGARRARTRAGSRGWIPPPWTPCSGPRRRCSAATRTRSASTNRRSGRIPS